MIRAKETKQLLEAVGLDPENITIDRAIEIISGWKNGKSCPNDVTVVNITDEMNLTTPYTFDNLEDAQNFVIEHYGAEDKLGRMGIEDALYEIQEELDDARCGLSFEIA